ncbi:hypothetical protein SCUCBS95973_001178 [Sporothrix curviconia]|uniref:F-box domain-containing protein n=1 Tax=Sporothrix curviconia TaxID=1260050 RepID=A0ABP0AWJ8_9PEZI
MVQHKIDYYCRLAGQPQRPPEMPETPEPSSASFLHLPYNVRRRIYILAGLVRFCPINLNQEGIRAERLRTGAKEITGFACFYMARRFFGNTFGQEDVPGCECAPLPVDLLYVSHAVSEEVSHILYSENSFTISRSDVWGLRPLRSLSSHAAASLRNLTVRLNNCECVFAFRFRGVHDIPPCHPLCASHRMHDAPLSIHASQGKAIVEDWEALLRQWAVHIQPGQLRLDFVCDTANQATAEHMTKLLTAWLPRLRECSVRLRHRPDWTHHLLANETATALLKKQQPALPPANKHSYSYRLPSEIILRILEFSDLVAPYELEWRPDGGFTPYDCCLACTATMDCCTCRRFHAASSTTCTCWTPPTALFLVSRRVHDLAMDVFYGRNRFLVMPRGCRMDGANRRAAGLPRQSLLEPFLARIPERAHSRIRFLGLVIPKFATAAVLPASDDKRTLAWTHTLRLIRQRLVVSQLQLSIYMGGLYHCRLPPDRKDAFATSEINMYRLVLGEELPSLHDLRDLFLFLQWPRQTAIEAVAERLEKEIKGPAYDSWAHGKWKSKPRIWYAGISREHVDVHAGLQQARDTLGCEVFVLANGTIRLQLDLIRSSGLAPVVDMQFSSQLLGAAKPTPGIYRRTLNLVGIGRGNP